MEEKENIKKNRIFKNCVNLSQILSFPYFTEVVCRLSTIIISSIEYKIKNLGIEIKTLATYMFKTCFSLLKL